MSLPPNPEAGLPEIYVGPAGLSNLEEAHRKEWVVTNGLGGYASSTVLGLNTRKYHGLLVAALSPPADRRVLLTRVDESASVQGKTHSTETIEFRDGARTEGYRLLEGFTLGPFPSYSYNLGGVRLRKTIFMPHGHNATLVAYEVSNPHDAEASIRVLPLVSFRHFYDVVTRDRPDWDITQKPGERDVHLRPSNSELSLVLRLSDGRYVAGAGDWVRGVRLRVDEERGESCLDDGFRPGHFELVVGPGETRAVHLAAAAGRTEGEALGVLASVTADGRRTVEEVYRSELRRRVGLLEGFRRRNRGVRMEDWLRWLVLAADSFLVSRGSTGTRSVIAGYHWFGEWGRDALIALPGLTLVQGRFQDAREVLLTFKRHCRGGLVPNLIPDRAGDEPAYNTVDATLWYFHAVLQYLKYTGDLGFVERELWETLRAIVEQHVKGATPNIRMDGDYLLVHGPQLTWMDVSVDGRPVTPRGGKAVEVQGLWYNALKTMEALALRLGQAGAAEDYRHLAEGVGESFVREFWNPKMSCLFDVVHGGGADPSLRPNQVIAASLDFSPLDRARSEGVVRAVLDGLWGTYGLRTLSRGDPRYVGSYSGGWLQRENAYHNGTVWAWLLGPLTTAFLKVKNHEERWRNFAFQTFLQPLFKEEVFRAGLGTVSEIFDGDSPHAPRGCISQAWSVAEPLRAYVEDVMLRRPPHEDELLGAPRDEPHIS